MSGFQNGLKSRLEIWTGCASCFIRVYNKFSKLAGDVESKVGQIFIPLNLINFQDNDLLKFLRFFGFWKKSSFRKKLTADEFDINKYKTYLKIL